MQNEIKKIYSKIQKLLVNLIPENWKSIYLYASVVNGKSGEMYFYYFPKKLIKTNPVNCYDVPNNFLINESAYNKSLQKLYSYIKSLNQITKPKWTNITIIIKNNLFTIEYHFDDITKSRYSDDERRILWCYKNLELPIESLNDKQRLLIEGYKEETKIRPIFYTEEMKHDNTSFDETDEVDENSANEREIKNQILK